MQPLGAHDPPLIGQYRLLGVLGVGGMGRVYLGRSQGGRTVAVKVVRPELIDTEFRARFRREVAAARRVDGRFTAPVLDADVDADAPWVATGYVAGFSLVEVVEQYGPLTHDALLVLAHGLAEALTAVHAAGLVHRDLKPANVLVTLDGPKVIDFGIARGVEDSRLTTTGKVIGSPGFLAPEQVTADPVGAAADIFAFGGVLVYAATGRGPFGVGDGLQMLWRVVYQEPELADLPEPLRGLAAACLSKDPAARPVLGDLLTELAALGSSQPSGWLPGPVVEAVSRRAVELLELESASAPPASAPVDPSRNAETVRGQPNDPDPRSAGRPSPGAAGWDYIGASGRENAGVAGYPGAVGAHYPGASSPEYAAGPLPPQPVPAGPAASPAPAAVAEIRRRRVRQRRTAWLIGGLVVCFAVVVSAFELGGRISAGESNEPAVTTATPAVETAESSGDTVSTVPAAFVGDWHGVARDGMVAFDIALTIREGAVGAEVAQASNTGQTSGSRCTRAETLTAATESELTLRARLTGGAADCMDDGATSTVTVQPDGALFYRTPGLIGSIEGELRKN